MCCEKHKTCSITLISVSIVSHTHTRPLPRCGPKQSALCVSSWVVNSRTTPSPRQASPRVSHTHMHAGAKSLPLGVRMRGEQVWTGEQCDASVQSQLRNDANTHTLSCERVASVTHAPWKYCGFCLISLLSARISRRFIRSFKLRLFHRHAF